MNGLLDHDSAPVRLYWARDNLGHQVDHIWKMKNLEEGNVEEPRGLSDMIATSCRAYVPSNVAPLHVTHHDASPMIRR